MPRSFEVVPPLKASIDPSQNASIELIPDEDVQDIDVSGIYEVKEQSEHIEVGAITEASPLDPENPGKRNEDTFFHSTRRGISLVADGMGGVPAGEYASAIASGELRKESLAASHPEESAFLQKQIERVFLAEAQETLFQTDVEAAMNGLLTRMNRVIEKSALTLPLIREKAIAKFTKEKNRAPNPDDPQDKRLIDMMLRTVGTTASLTKIWKTTEGKPMVTVGNVGDSRVYILRNGELKALSQDHSPLGKLIELGVKDRQGNPLSDQDVNQEFSKADLIRLADTYPDLQPAAMKYMRNPTEFIRVGDIRNMISQGLGIASLNKDLNGMSFTPFVKSFELQDDDVLVHVSDGVIDNLEDAQIEHGLNIAIEQGQSLAQAAEEIQKRATLTSLRDRASFPRAKKDDTTIVLTRYHAGKTQTRKRNSLPAQSTAAA